MGDFEHTHHFFPRKQSVCQPRQQSANEETAGTKNSSLTQPAQLSLHLTPVG